jgi:glycerol-3-phosphate acyltransferase PlsY
MISFAAVIIICYLIGSIPTAFVVVKKLKGVDIRTVGSGNVGASNAGRVLGKWGFFGIMFADAMKGFIPVTVLLKMYGQADVVLFGTVAVVLGHTFTIFLNFKGGKGVATGLGVFLALAPLQTLVATVVFGVLLALFRMISLGSVTAAAVLAAEIWFMSDWQNLKYFAIVIAALVIILHRGNIVRILKGEERKVGKSS